MSLHTPTTEVMIDIETLSTATNAVVLSVGIVRFTQDDIFTKKQWVLPLGEQFKKARDVSESTLLWWADQNPEAFKKAFSKQREGNLHMALHDMNSMFFKAGNVWANSPSFDATIMESLYEDFNKCAPWLYRQLRDVRTLKDLAGIESDWEPADFEPVPHDPVSDCIWQVKLVQEARRRLGIVA